MGPTPGNQLVKDWLAPLDSPGEDLVVCQRRIMLADLFLDLVDLFVGREWKRRALITRVERLGEVAPRMTLILSTA